MGAAESLSASCGSRIPSASSGQVMPTSGSLQRRERSQVLLQKPLAL